MRPCWQPATPYVNTRWDEMRSYVAACRRRPFTCTALTAANLTAHRTWGVVSTGDEQARHTDSTTALLTAPTSSQGSDTA